MILKHAQHAEKVPKRASYHARCCSFLVGVFIFILNTRDKKKQRYYLCIFLFCQLRHHKLQLLSAVFIISGFCLVHTKSIFTHASIGSPEHTHSHTLSHTHRGLRHVRDQKHGVSSVLTSWCELKRQQLMSEWEEAQRADHQNHRRAGDSGSDWRQHFLWHYFQNKMIFSVHPEGWSSPIFYLFQNVMKLLTLFLLW